MGGMGLTASFENKKGARTGAFRMNSVAWEGLVVHAAHASPFGLREPLGMGYRARLPAGDGYPPHRGRAFALLAPFGASAK